MVECRRSKNGRHKRTVAWACPHKVTFGCDFSLHAPKTWNFPRRHSTRTHRHISPESEYTRVEREKMKELKMKKIKLRRLWMCCFVNLFVKKINKWNRKMKNKIHSERSNGIRNVKRIVSSLELSEEIETAARRMITVLFRFIFCRLRCYRWNAMKWFPLSRFMSPFLAWRIRIVTERNYD